jgi:hypothetical protein
VFREWLRDLCAAGIGHGLTAALLIERITRLATMPLEQFQCRLTDSRINLVDIAGNKQADVRHGCRFHGDQKEQQVR